MALLPSASGQRFPRDAREWKLEYRIDGGIAGIDRRLSLTQAGELADADAKFGSHAVGHASDELMRKLRAWLGVAREAKKPGNPMPDALYSSVIVTTAGRQYQLDLPDEVAQMLNGAINTLFQQAVLGNWRQAGWKLCHPVPQMQASEVEPPIDDLAFHSDGTFSVTWRGGGAHTTGLPHQFLPDYKGHYKLFPETGSIRMNFDGGIFVPKDFLGEGSFRIETSQLTLRNVWFGTKQAKQRPDVCELTFVKQATASEN